MRCRSPCCWWLDVADDAELIDRRSRMTGERLIERESPAYVERLTSICTGTQFWDDEETSRWPLSHLAQVSPERFLMVIERVAHERPALRAELASWLAWWGPDLGPWSVRALVLARKYGAANAEG